MFIVARNYRDRNAEKKWLVREEKQRPEEAVEVSHVLLSGL
jgi:hypothetical protein